MIRKAEEKDVIAIMEIVIKIKEEMKFANNPQWDDTYPLNEDFLKDIKRDTLYVYEEDKKVVAFICITFDFDEEYNFLDAATKEKSYIIHRMGINENYRHRGIATKLMRYAEEKAIKENIFMLKADTEESNYKMNQLFLKMGYSLVTQLKWPDCSGRFNYYEKRIG